MKKLYYALFACLLVGMASLQAQRTVFIPSTGATLGGLNDAIFGDTLANGERVDTNTVYLLEAGGYYLLNGSIENRFPLTIMVKDSSAGGRPVLQPGVDGGGGSSRAFRPRADLHLDGVYVTNADNGGGLNTRIIRASADDIRLTFNDCHFDRDGQSMIRMDGDNIKVYLSNCVVSNIGQTSSMNNGRVIDDRGNPIDSIWMVNNTFFNITSTIIRDDGDEINFFWFRHNTVVNTGQRVLQIGAVKEATITNNLMINPGFIGISPNEDPDYIVAIDTLRDTSGNPLPQMINMKNNNFSLDTASLASFYPDTVDYKMLLNPAAQAFLDEQGTGSTITAELVTFTSSPAAPGDVIAAEWDTSATPPPMDDGMATTIDQLPFDFAYGAGSASATGSTAGQPLGDLNWWGVEALSVEDRLLQASANLSTYPNPFSGRATIEYQLTQAQQVAVRLFNQQGQLLHTLFQGQQLPGTYQHDLNAETLPAGVYVIQLQAGDAVAFDKVMLVK